MQEKLLIALCHTFKGYLTEPNATRLIQQAFRTLETHLHASYAFIALQDRKTSYLHIKHSFGIGRQALQSFHKRIGSNTIGRIFFKDSFFLVQKSDQSDDYAELKIEKDYHTCVAVHIGWEGRAFGFMAIYFDQAVEIDLSVKNFFLAMGGACSAALEKEELLRIISELRQFDVDTGIYTHQFFISKLEKEIHATQFEDKTLALMVLDMNNYKEIINLHGIEAAQETLRLAAEELKSHIKGRDVLGSLGIDEFILFMPATDADAAGKAIEAFEQRLKVMTFTDHDLKTSFSCGITQLRDGEDDLDALIHRAQMALYNARKATGNSICIEL
ncbi:MAG: GGDEF domain-containing protein [Candidatus Riflebacteria bacterium]|nr:GGDEF domain-containing protein [Candidatus Riflebacteria bacterium]